MNLLVLALFEYFLAQLPERHTCYIYANSGACAELWVPRALIYAELNNLGTRAREIAGVETMLWTIIIILLILWLLGLVSGYTLGGVLHILLVVAVIVLILNLVRGRRVV